MARPGKIIEAEQRSSIQEVDGTLAGRLGRMSLGRQVITLAIWPLLEQILSFMVNTVDLILATRMADGDTRVAVMDALGLGGYAMWLMMILQGAVATGVLAIVARAAGAPRRAGRARRCGRSRRSSGPGPTVLLRFESSTCYNRQAHATSGSCPKTPTGPSGLLRPLPRVAPQSRSLETMGSTRDALDVARAHSEALVGTQIR